MKLIFFLCRFSELKSQYAEQQTSGTNINELPQLLQAIHTHKPTVFKSGGPQYQQRSKVFSDKITVTVFDGNLFIFPHLVARSTNPHQSQTQQNPYQSNAMQPNAFYATESHQQSQIWNPQCPSQASTSSFHQQQPVIIQQAQPVAVRINQQQPLQSPQPLQQHILPQQSSTMPMPMVDVNNVIVKQEYPSTIPPMQSNVMQYMQQSPSALPHQLMQNSEKPQMRSLRSSDSQPMSVPPAYHSTPIPVNQYPVQQQSAVLNVPNIMSPSNMTQSNTVFYQQQQQQQPQQQFQQRTVLQPNSVPATNQSNM